MRLLALSAVLLAAGCSGPRTGLAVDLPGTVWLVDRIVGADGSVRRGTGETVTFGTDGRIALASCNLCHARYALDGDGTLTLDEGFACTRRGCAEGAIELERDLPGPVQIRRTGEYLVLDGAPGQAQILLLPETAPAAPAEAPAGRL